MREAGVRRIRTSPHPGPTGAATQRAPQRVVASFSEQNGPIPDPKMGESVSPKSDLIWYQKWNCFWSKIGSIFGPKSGARFDQIRVCDRVRNGPKTWPPGGMTCFPTGKHTFLGGGHVCGSFLTRSQTRIWSNRAPNFGPKMNPILVANRTQNRTHLGTQNRTHFGTENDSIFGPKIDQFWNLKSTHFGTQNRPILGLKMDPLLVPKWVRFWVPKWV